MKPRILQIILMLLSLNLMAQNDKGNFFVETGVKLDGGSDFLNFTGKTGLSFNQNKNYWKYKNEPDTHSHSVNNTSFSISPRLGYYFTEKLNGGVDIQYYNSSSGYYLNKYRILTSGIFLRYFFTDKKISPLLELKTGAGGSKDKRDSRSSGGAAYTEIDCKNLFYYSISGGAMFVLNEKFHLNLSVIAQNTFEKYSDRGNVSSSTTKISNWEIVPMSSVTFIFGNKKDK